MSKRTNLGIFLIILALLLGMGSVAVGATIYVDADASAGGDGTGWGAAFTYLQDALDAAVSGDEIRVAQGTYKPDQYSTQPAGSGLRTDTFQLINGVTIRGGYAGLGEPDPDARDIHTYETTLSGDIGSVSDLWDNSYQVVTGINVDHTAVLDGATITGGNADAEGIDPYDRGSGMRNSQSSPTLINCTFVENWSFDGGAMHNSDGSSPTLTHCTFIDNATERGGGAINNQGQSSPTLTHCTFTYNSAGWGGGAINNVGGSDATFINCLFSYNSAGWGGGGMDNMGSDPAVINCTFSGNWAGWAGAIGSGGGSRTTVTNSILWGNPPQEIVVDGGEAIVVSFCNVQGMWPGTDNIDADPLFTDPVVGDYHLRLDSPCINTGHNLDVPPSVVMDLEGNNRIAGGTVDMGAYESKGSPISYVDVHASGNNNGTSWKNAFNDLQDALADPGHEIRVAQGIYTPDGPLQYHASDPYPLDKSPVPVSQDADVSWTAAAYATSHDVYFGTSSPGTFQGNQKGTVFDPGMLDSKTEYYWRIDEVGPHGTTTGSVWSFTTALRTPRSIIRSQAISSEGFDRTATFQLRNGVVLKGGYGGVSGSDPNARDITLYRTILSGDLAYNDVDVQNPRDLLNDLGRAENSYHVVSGSDCNESAVLNGFIITAGNASSHVVEDPNSRGGGIYNDSGSPTLSHCTIIWNASAWEGGGMYNRSGSPMLANCTFQGNSAEHGGAIHNSWETVSMLTNCTFSGNVAGKGGAIYNGLETIPILTNCTLTGNLAILQGGGIYIDAQSTPRIMNCILWDNTAPSGSQIYKDETSQVMIAYSDVQDGGQDQGNMNAEPCFVDPGYWNLQGVWINGDYHLLQTSPCINAGDNKKLMEDIWDLDGDSDTTEPVPYDLDGNPRIIDNVVDLGAFECSSRS